MLPSSFTPQLLSQLEMLKVQTRRRFLGSRQGGHLSLKRGHGIEFSDFRQYELGDNPRHIDWAVYARSERLYVKRFQEEQNLSVLVLLDASASMFTPAEDKKWEMARDISLALSYITLMEQDSVAIAALGAMSTPVCTGPKAIHHLGRSLLDAKPREQADLQREVQAAAARMRFPGAAIFISDFLMPLDVIEQLFRPLRAKNLDLTAIQVLGVSDINPLPGATSAVVVDSESGEEVELVMDEEVRQEYGSMLVEHNEKLKQFLAQRRISYALAMANDELADIIMKVLPSTGLVA